MRRRLLLTLRLAVVAGCLVAPSALTAGTAHAEPFVPISGAGSTWSSNAVDQWRRNVQQFGLQVNFTANGSSAGRQAFASRTVDFAVSEIPYGTVDNGQSDPAPSRAFAYMPIVAGGTSFMYNLRIGGRQVTNLRLSGETITKIFTGVIKKWNDPAIRADNPQLALPARDVRPVVRSDGSGTSAQFSLWMSKQYPSLWNDFCRRVGRATPCGQTSNYPAAGFKALSGSLGVSQAVADRTGEGLITYVEYSYAINLGFPVVKVLNRAGYYTEPTARSVAVALLAATINPDLTQKLDGVYASPDPRTYPLSSYSYMIIPTKLEAPLNADKGRTLGRFAYYFLCEGQQQVDKLGYSPLPINLVRAGLTQVARIPGVARESLDPKTCNNPTFSADGTNTLAKTAPYPLACDKQGPTQCGTGTAGAAGTPTRPSAGGGTTGGSRNTGGTNAGGTGGTGGTGSTGGTGGTGTARPTGAARPGATARPSAGAVDPATGAVIDPATGATASGGGQDGEAASAVPVDLAADSGPNKPVLSGLAIALLIGLVVGPPLTAQVIRRRGP